jgi:hypothetical protein
MEHPPSPVPASQQDCDHRLRSIVHEALRRAAADTLLALLACGQACLGQACAAALALLLCAAHTAAAAAATAPEPGKSGAELEKAIEANVEAQDMQEETTPVNAQIIKAEPAAALASGTGDISTTGAHSPRRRSPCLPRATRAI